MAPNLPHTIADYIRVGYANGAPTTILSSCPQQSQPDNSHLALVIGQGISCAKLRRMAKTGVDACFPQQFALHIYKYDDEDERTAYTNGHGCLLWIKIRSLGEMPEGIYVRGEICRAYRNAAQSCDIAYGGIPAKHRGHPAVQLLRPGTEIQFIHHGALADGPVYQLSDHSTGETYLPYVPKKLDGYSKENHLRLLSSIVPLSNFIPRIAAAI